MTHSSICIAFVITDASGTDNHFEAVGFLGSRERVITIGQALKRGGRNVVDDQRDHAKFIYNSDQFPEELRRFRWLLTELPDCKPSACVHYWYLYNNEWRRHSVDRDFYCDRSALVLRRKEVSR